MTLKSSHLHLTVCFLKVAEIALLRMKRLHPKSKCVYIAPLKSLARERLKEWKRRLGSKPLNWSVLELSGDTSHDERALKNADVLVCTPEKWDLISRGWRGSNDSDAKDFVKDVRLLVIDEIHLLGEERGAVLEAIVSRTRFISKLLNSESGVNQSKSNGEADTDATRIIGLSTAIANPHDLADWIGINISHGESNCIGLYNFHPSVRPVSSRDGVVIVILFAICVKVQINYINLSGFHLSYQLLRYLWLYICQVFQVGTIAPEWQL